MFIILLIECKFGKGRLSKSHCDRDLHSPEHSPAQPMTLFSLNLINSHRKRNKRKFAQIEWFEWPRMWSTLLRTQWLFSVTRIYYTTWTQKLSFYRIVIYYSYQIIYFKSSCVKISLGTTSIVILLYKHIVAMRQT